MSTSEEWAPSYEDTGLQHLLVMEYEMGDDGEKSYDYVNEESDDEPIWGRVNGVHEPVTPRDYVMYDGIIYDDMNEESEDGPNGWRVSGAHEPIISGDNMIYIGDNIYEIEIDRERDLDLLLPIKINRENDRDRGKTIYLVHPGRSAAAA